MFHQENVDDETNMTPKGSWKEDGRNETQPKGYTMIGTVLV